VELFLYLDAGRAVLVAPGRWWSCFCFLMLAGAVLVAPFRWWNCFYFLMLAGAVLVAPGRWWSCSCILMLAGAVLVAPGRWWSCSCILMLAGAVLAAPCNGGTVPVFDASRDYSCSSCQMVKLSLYLDALRAVLVAPVRWWSCSCILMIAGAVLVQYSSCQMVELFCILMLAKQFL
jgi:hypothetical protein